MEYNKNYPNSGLGGGGSDGGEFGPTGPVSMNLDINRQIDYSN